MATEVKKPTAVELQRRVMQVAQMLLAGFMRHEIMQLGADTWNICERTTDNYIRRANDLLEDELSSTRDEIAKVAARRYEMLFRRALKGNDFDLARKITNDQCRLWGVQQQAEPGAQTNVQINFGDVSEADVDARVRELERRSLAFRRELEGRTPEEGDET
jgi:hypothetical protein